MEPIEAGAPAGEDEKAARKRRKWEKGVGTRVLDPWERYRALCDLYDSLCNVTQFADRKARFALLIMVFRNQLPTQLWAGPNLQRRSDKGPSIALGEPFVPTIGSPWTWHGVTGACRVQVRTACLAHQGLGAPCGAPNRLGPDAWSITQHTRPRDPWFLSLLHLAARGAAYEQAQRGPVAQKPEPQQRIRAEA